MTVAARLAGLLDTPQLPALGPARRADTLTPSALTEALKSILTADQLHSSAGQAVRALLLLWHDHLDAAHELAQSVENADGSFVHAILHRREPDAWNSKYWWRRVGQHPAFAELASRAAKRLQAVPADDLARKLLRGGGWDASAFVDACDAASDLPLNDPRVAVLRELQRLETEVLLAHLARQLG